MRRTLCRLLLTGLIAWLLGWMTSLDASAEVPVCALSRQAEATLIELQAKHEARIGVAVIDLESNTRWSGGLSARYAIHSTIKPPLVWAVMMQAEQQERELSDRELLDLFRMIVLSANEQVGHYLRQIGGGLSEYYIRWDVPEAVPFTNRNDWGRSLITPLELARIYAALATSETISDSVRQQGFELLRQVIPQQRWGAFVPEPRLPGWESLIKIGSFVLPDPDDEELQDHSPEIRLHSAAIWLDSPPADSKPRYVTVIMGATNSSWQTSLDLHNRIGAILASAIADREAGRSNQPTSACLKQALS